MSNVCVKIRLLYVKSCPWSNIIYLSFTAYSLHKFLILFFSLREILSATFALETFCVKLLHIQRVIPIILNEIQAFD